jgi:hypothetical protein
LKEVRKSLEKLETRLGLSTRSQWTTSTAANPAPLPRWLAGPHNLLGSSTFDSAKAREALPIQASHHNQSSAANNYKRRGSAFWVGEHYHHGAVFNKMSEKTYCQTSICLQK